MKKRGYTRLKNKPPHPRHGLPKTPSPSSIPQHSLSHLPSINQQLTYVVMYLIIYMFLIFCLCLTAGIKFVRSSSLLYPQNMENCQEHAEFLINIC